MDMPVGIDWSPGIGDPTLAGWLTVVAYAGATILCYLAARADRNNRHIWTGASGFELLLGINKQLDVQVLLFETARYLAKSGGWYAVRREFQHAFVAALAVAFVVVIAVALVKARRRPWPVGIALAGALIQLAFVGIRAATFDHVDAALQTPAAGIAADIYLENIGILVVAVGASLAFRAARRRLG